MARVNYKLPKQEVEDIVKCAPEAVERVLLGLKRRLEVLLDGTEQEARPEAQRAQRTEPIRSSQQKPKGKEASVVQRSPKDDVIKELKETVEVFSKEKPAMSRLCLFEREIDFRDKDKQTRGAHRSQRRQNKDTRNQIGSGKESLRAFQFPGDLETREHRIHGRD